MEATQVEIYTCSMCGITSDTHKDWGPICKKTGSRVCDLCCYRCEHHVSWSGIWRCSFVTPEDRREAALKRIRDREHAENARITEIYVRRRREEARKWAIKRAKAKSREGTNDEEHANRSEQLSV